MKRKFLLLIGGMLIAITVSACTPILKLVPLVDEPGDGTQEATEPSPTETLEPSETPEATETIAPTGEVTATPETTDEAGRAGCPGNPAGSPPPAAALAAAFNVSENEIMGWFCQGFGFGEIKKAYAWASLTGRPVDELFALKAQGMGWGQIAHSLDIKPGNKPCWAGPDHGASDPSCVKPGTKGGNGKSNKGGNGKGNGNGGKGHSGGNNNGE